MTGSSPMQDIQATDTLYQHDSLSPDANTKTTRTLDWLSSHDLQATGHEHDDGLGSKQPALLCFSPPHTQSHENRQSKRSARCVCMLVGVRERERESFVGSRDNVHKIPHSPSAIDLELGKKCRLDHGQNSTPWPATVHREPSHRFLLA